MNKVAVCFVAIFLGLSLSGCTEKDVSDNILTACGFVAPAKLVVGVITDITGKPPLAGIAIDVVQSATEAICAAFKKQKESPGGRAFVAVRVQNQVTGVVTVRSLNGNVISRSR